MIEVLTVVFVVVAFALIGFILIQHGKGADMGASFGAGGANTLFGAAGSGNFLTKSTAVLATLFFLTCLGLSFLASRQVNDDKKLIDLVEEKAQTIAPKVDDVVDTGSAEAAMDTATKSTEVDNDVPVDAPTIAVEASGNDAPAVDDSTDDIPVE